MCQNEKLIQEVNGTMSIEGMPLTKDDIRRMTKFLENPKCYEEIISSLIKKHTVKPKGIAHA